VSPLSNELRRKLRPQAWVTLEDVAMEAVVEDGRLVAHTSSRRVAERLGVDVGTAAAALRALRERGLLVLERESGQAGRFGLSVYVLGSIAGLSVVKPRANCPCVVGPPVQRPDVPVPDMVVPYTDMPWMEQQDMAGSPEPTRGERQRPAGSIPLPSPALTDGAQGALDLGLGSA
jgi:hypothetical protein